jgi:hypothetical protein
MENPNIPSGNQEDEIQQNNNNTDNMYSYRDENNPQNNQESGNAIRRSMGDVNPSNSQGFNKNQFGSNNNNNHINNNSGGVDDFNISEKSSESNRENNLFWVPYLILGCLEGAIILALALLMEYQYDIDSSDDDDKIEKDFNYGQLRDINIMAFIGFGLLHTILKRNSLTAVSINTLLIAFSVQVALFFNFVWKAAFKEIWVKEPLNFYVINKAIFISCSVSITFGCVVGKLSVIQYLIMALFEIVLASMNMQLLQEKLETVDTGGALYIHTFGAVFAISISVVLFCSTKSRNKLQRFQNLNMPNYFSYITSFLGVLFTFCFFPSFNSILSNVQSNINRARINTYLSLFGSVVGSVVTSGIINQGKFVLEQILYGVLSGGIIISGCCTVCFFHWAAMILGTCSGAIAVVILALIKPYFINWGFRDTCNVILIHGVFGILGGFITPMFIRGLNHDNDVVAFNLFVDTKRGTPKQAGIQVGGLFITMGISFVGGIATGFLMKVSSCNKIKILFNDVEFFENLDEEIDNKLNEDDFDKGSQPSYN